MSEIEEQGGHQVSIFGQVLGVGKSIGELENLIAQLKSIDIWLKEMQSIFTGFADGLLHGLAVVQDGNIVWANEASCRMFGYKFEEVVNTSGIILAHPDYREKLAARLNNIQAGDVLPTYDIWPFLTKSRVVKQIGSYANRVFFHGKPAILVILVDMSEEQALQDELLMKAEIIELITDFVFMLDVRGRIKYVNKAMYEALGYTPDEMMGRSILDFHTPEQKERVSIRLKLATPTSAGVYKTVYVCKDGTMITVSARGKMIMIGGVQYVLALARPTELARLHDVPI